MASWRERLQSVRSKSNCRVTTRGRRTGKPHTVTVWFAVEGDEVYLGTLRMNRDWPKNARKNGEIQIQIGDVRLRGEVRLVSDEARRRFIEDLLNRKYWVSRIGAWFGLKPEGVFEVRILGDAG